MFINNFDPVAFQILSLEIRWYSLAYILEYYWMVLSKKIFIQDKEIKEKFDDYITYLIIRYYYRWKIRICFFYNFDYY